jgi:hypothetical protein
VTKDEPAQFTSTFMGLRLTRLDVWAALAYSLRWRRCSRAERSAAGNADALIALLGRCLNWLRMIWPCTTTKRSTAGTY